LALGFLECVSGPLVRSSYRAEQALARNNAGLNNATLNSTGTDRAAMRPPTAATVPPATAAAGVRRDS
jgi:hypothetical protein